MLNATAKSGKRTGLADCLIPGYSFRLRKMSLVKDRERQGGSRGGKKEGTNESENKGKQGERKGNDF